MGRNLKVRYQKFPEGWEFHGSDPPVLPPIMDVVRHGETKLNQENRFRSVSDPPIDPAGISQAVEASDLLEKRPYTRIIASPLQRTQATANIIALPHSVQVELEPRLFPWHLGYLIGLPRDAQHEAELEWYVSHPDEVIPGGGESLNAFSDRTYDVFDELLNAAEDRGPFCVVCQGSNVAILNSILAVPDGDVALKPGGIASVYVNTYGYEMEVAHAPDPGVTFYPH